MQVRVVQLPDHVDVELIGQVDLQKLLGLILKLGSRTRASGDTRMLFDLLRLRGEMHVAGQMQVGEEVARCLPHMAGIASVVPLERITRTSEKVACSLGARLKVFDSRDAAIAWLRITGPPGEPVAEDPPVMDAARSAIWAALCHLFPPHAQAIQLPNGTLAISWSISHDPGAIYEMATPITKRIAAQQEAAFRAGLMGYDPYTALPSARVIVLG